MMSLVARGYGAVSGNSRLIREDENDLSDEDEGMTSHMTFGKKAEPARQMEVTLSKFILPV